MSLLRCIGNDGSTDPQMHRKMKQKRRNTTEEIDKMIESCIALADEESKQQRKSTKTRIVDPRNRRGGMPMKLGVDIKSTSYGIPYPTNC